MDDEAFLLSFIITNEIKHNGWWGVPTFWHIYCKWIHLELTVLFKKNHRTLLQSLTEASG
jgi:hypothetical protein